MSRNHSKIRQPRILLLDIETAPMLSSIWGIWKQDVPTHMIHKEWYMLCWAAMDVETGMMYSDSLHNYRGFKRHLSDDKKILKKLWQLLDAADVIIAHNGDRFDIPRINTRFIKQGMLPPSPYRQLDTLKMAKRHFAFTSNRLDYIAATLGVARKADSGWALWQGCLAGDVDAFKQLLKYCEQDVRVLHDVYLKLRPWGGKGAAIPRLDDNEALSCPTCGSADVQRRGYTRTRMYKYSRFKCNGCGAWSRARMSEDRGVIKLT